MDTNPHTADGMLLDPSGFRGTVSVVLLLNILILLINLLLLALRIR